MLVWEFIFLLLSICLRGLPWSSVSSFHPLWVVPNGTSFPEFSKCQKSSLIKDSAFIESNKLVLSVGCSAKRLFFSYVLPSTYMVPLGDWSPQKKFQHYRPINGFGMAIWSFDLFYNVKTAEIGAKIFKINKMAKNHFSRSNLVSLGVFLGVLGASLVNNSGLRILIRATKVPFLPPKWLKWPRFDHFGGTKNDTLVARIKILRPCL